MCHAPAPPHHRLLPRANYCRALCPNPTAPTLRIPHLTPDTLSILTLLAFHHSSDSHSIPLSFPHWPSPILATIPSTTCVLKRFPLTSPRKLSLPCVKRGFLRTQSLTELHNYPHVAPQVSQCHVHAVSGSDVPCPCAIPHLTPDSLSITMACVLKRFPLTSPRKLSLPCVKRGFLRTQSLTELHNYPHVAPQVSQCHVHAVSGSDVPCPCAIPHLTPDSLSITMACVLKRFPLTSPRKLSLTCVKRGFLRTAGSH